MGYQERYLCDYDVSIWHSLSPSSGSAQVFNYRVFDNGGEYGEYDESSSRGLYLALNFTSMTVELLQDFIPYNYTVSESQGSVQLQPNGNFLVG